MVTLLHQRRLCEHDNSTASFTCFILKSETMPQETPPPSIERRAFVGTSWLALFRLVSQVFSWTATILVARMLEPSDYGLLEIAVIIPGYALKLSELGLGPAIIQRSQTTQDELSSVFWFSVFIALFLSAICYGVAPLTVWLFNEPKLLVLTQAVSVLFLLQGLQVVPNTLLRKELDFKTLGQIEILAVIISSVTMLIIAKSGGGVWTLILLGSDRERLRNFYLRTVNICATLVFPLFVGGFLVGADLVQVLLSDKWAPISRIFEYLCLAQIMLSLNAVNSFVHNAQGRASWSSLYFVACAILVSLSFFLAVPYGLEAALIPWFTTYVVLSVSWIAITTRKIGITHGVYLKGLSIPFAATLTMA